MNNKNQRRQKRHYNTWGSNYNHNLNATNSGPLPLGANSKFAVRISD